jgi:hypothetical protein
MIYADGMKQQPHRQRKPKPVADSNQEMTLSSLCELNRSLRQQAVDLVLSITAMKESAGLLSGANLRDPTNFETEFGSVFRSLRSAGPAKSRTRTLRGD